MQLIHYGLRIALTSFTAFILSCSSSSMHGDGGRFSSKGHVSSSSDGLKKSKQKEDPKESDVTRGEEQLVASDSTQPSDGDKLTVDPDEIEGSLTKLVNISFEDSVDDDYNDISFCFSGYFKVDDRKVVYVGEEKRRLKVTVKRLTGASDPRYSFASSVKDGRKKIIAEHILLQKSEEKTHDVSFESGHRIHASYNNAGGYHDETGTRAIVTSDECKNTGD